LWPKRPKTFSTIIDKLILSEYQGEFKVIIDPASLDIMALPSVALADYRQLPDTTALYFIVNAIGKLLYIGQSIELKTRWRTHHRLARYQQLEGIRIAWLDLSDRCPVTYRDGRKKYLVALERSCIAYFRPPDNRGQGLRYLRIEIPIDLADWLESQPIEPSTLVTQLVATARSRQDCHPVASATP
jgi:GIY-YIG catalytic domain